jgi:hypothetical protein
VLLTNPITTRENAMQKYNAILSSAYNRTAKTGNAATPATVLDMNLSTAEKLTVLESYKAENMKEKKPLFSNAEIEQAITLTV